MAGVTNRGKYRILEWAFRAATPAGTGLAFALCTAATTPTADTDTLSQLTEIAVGNGYTSGGLNVNRDSTDFDVLTEDDATDRAFIQLKDMTWTASGGPIPATGGGARWAVLTDRNATVGSREVIAYFDLVSDRSVSNGQSLTIRDAEIRAVEA